MPEPKHEEPVVQVLSEFSEHAKRSGWVGSLLAGVGLGAGALLAVGSIEVIGLAAVGAGAVAVAASLIEKLRYERSITEVMKSLEQLDGAKREVLNVRLAGLLAAGWSPRKVHDIVEEVEAAEDSSS